MPYRPDGAVLSSRWPWGRPRLAFGWLDPAHDFTRGDCPPHVVAALEDAARTPVDRTRGWQRCGLCPRDEHGPTSYTTTAGDQLSLGDASLEVPARGRTRWVAPTLVLHYIHAHGYRPPQDLVDLLGSPP